MAAALRGWFDARLIELHAGDVEAARQALYNVQWFEDFDLTEATDETRTSIHRQCLMTTAALGDSAFVVLAIQALREARRAITA